MKIVMIHPHDVMTSPWTIRIINLGRGLLKRGHTVRAYYFIEPDRRKAGYITADARTDFGVPLQPLNKYRFLENACHLARELDDTSILHIQKCFAHVTIPAVLAAYTRKVPIHYDWDDWEEGITRDYLGDSAFTKLIGLYEKKLPGLVDSLSVASDALKQRAIEAGFPADRCVKIPVGADRVHFNPRVEKTDAIKLPEGDGPLVVYAGQIEGANYANHLLDVAARVVSEHPETRFMVVGGGYRLPELIELAREKKVDKNIMFTDYIHHKHMPQVLAHADVCVATFEDNETTRSKSPLKIVEYMAMGKAIVASDVGEVSSMLSQSGVLIPPGNSALMAQAIVELCRRPEQRQALGEKAREQVSHEYNWDTGSAKLERIYKKMLSEH